MPVMLARRASDARAFAAGIAKSSDPGGMIVCGQ
jgi:hypothetical protein